MKTGILVDTTFYAEIEKYESKEYLIRIPLAVNYEDMTFVEKPEDEEQLTTIYEEAKKRKRIPQSSQPSAGEFMEKYQELINMGCERIFAFHLSEKLSGTYQGSVAAAQMVEEENPNVKIHVIESSQVAYTGYSFVEDVYSRKDEISKEEVEQLVEYYRNNSEIYLVLDTLDFLSYGGRIPKALAKVGNLLNVKPMISFKNGTLEKEGTVRSMKAGMAKQIEVLKTEMDSNDDDYDVFLAYTSEKTDVERLEKALMKEENSRISIVSKVKLGAIIGLHLGPDVVALGWIRRNKL